MPIRSFRMFVAISCLMLGWVVALPTLAQADEDVLAKDTLTSIADFEEIESITEQLAPRAVAATVGVQLGNAFASGVVVTADGYVLTASHVAGAPGRHARLTFSDGRIAEGITLGQNPDVDGALIKINGPGTWPFVPMADRDVKIAPGDWCIATGHPGGLDYRRSAPVRLGRIIHANGYTLRSDCPIEPGDSGGPLIDLHGYVIGVHSRIFDDATGNLHVPISTFWRTWDKLTHGQVTQLGPSSSFLAQFDFDQDGSLTYDELPSGPRQAMYQRLAETYGFEIDQPQEIETLREKIGLNLAKRPRSQASEPGELLFTSPGHQEVLTEPYYTRGMLTMNVLRRVTDQASRATCEVLINGDEVAMGTIVDDEGWIVTKASEVRRAEVSSRITCHLADSRRYRALLVDVDHQYDLAWLKIDAVDLVAISWSDGVVPSVGSWVISSGRGRTPLSLGIVSVGPRKINSTPGLMGVIGSPARGDAYVESIRKDSGAARSDLQLGDVIISVNNIRVSSFSDLRRQVSRYLGGDVIRLKVIRDDKTLDIPIRLGYALPPMQDGPDMSGRLSDRRDGFPLAMLHDTVLLPQQCGGPLINLQGQAVGINIARNRRSGTLAAMPETIMRSLDSAKQTVNRLTEKRQ